MKQKSHRVRVAFEFTIGLTKKPASPERTPSLFLCLAGLRSDIRYPILSFVV